MERREKIADGIAIIAISVNEINNYAWLLVEPEIWAFDSKWTKPHPKYKFGTY